MPDEKKPATTLAAMWGVYREQVVPKTAGQVQVTETRRTFYAACFGVLMLMLEEVALLPDDEAEAQLSALFKEAQDFGRGVGQGDL